MRQIHKTLVVAALAATAGIAFAEVRLQGAGATFPDPLYQRLVTEYQKSRPDVKIDYQSNGSGAGVKAITEKTVAFAGSDAPLNKAEIEKLGGPDAVVQVPSCAGGNVPAYNLPGVTAALKFTGDLLAKIYMGSVSKWNAKEIAELNPEAVLPDLAITPAWRTDGSGTTYLWTNYLATQSAEFKSSIGTGKSVKWPVGQGGKGNPGVAAVVQQTPGALGYIELNYALQNKIAFGAVKNKAGKFVKATAATIQAAGQGAVDAMNGNILAANIWDQPGDDAYPIASFTYLIVYRNLENVPSKGDAQALVDFLWWATHEGQRFAPELDYAPLAKGVQEKAEKALKSITWKGEALAPATATAGGR